MHGLIIETIIPWIYKKPVNIYLCNYFNYSPNILREKKEVDEKVEFCREQCSIHSFQGWSYGLDTIASSGSEALVAKKKKKDDNTRDYAKIYYFLLLTKRFQVMVLLMLISHFLNERIT